MGSGLSTKGARKNLGESHEERLFRGQRQGGGDSVPGGGDPGWPDALDASGKRAAVDYPFCAPLTILITLGSVYAGPYDYCAKYIPRCPVAMYDMCSSELDATGSQECPRR